ncbi:MAG: GNAT family N-acetyltransferase [Xanthomonadaceae bacterium]|nr:GNAT family N-acetyltransferase [Xanthomonadaceae bacterium]
MIEADAFEVRIARWPEDSLAIREVREAVFVVEQRVAAKLEWDGLDEECTHALALTADGIPVGTGRLAPDGKIGRMAVLREYRGRGIGEAILKCLLDVVRDRNLPRCYLHSQTHALGFYTRHGFVAHGPEFDEADIPHREMVLEADA